MLINNNLKRMEINKNKWIFNNNKIKHNLLLCIIIKINSIKQVIVNLHQIIIILSNLKVKEI